MREKMKQFIEIIKGLLKYPIVFALVVIGFVLAFIQDVFQTESWIFFIQLVGVVIIAAFLAVILITDKNGKKYINKIGICSIFWFASCIALVDFSEFNFELFVRIVASLEFIFLGCLIPDYISLVERERDDTIKKLEERIAALEKNQAKE